MPTPLPKLASILTIVLCVGASALAITTYAADRRARAQTATFFDEYTHTLRRPLVAETVGYAPRADWLGGIVSDAVLNDVYGEVNLNDLEPEQREAWLAILPRIDDELKASRALLLDSFRARPGWALHPASLGQIEYTLQRRPGGTLEPERWRAPLKLGAASAPGNLSVPIFHAAGEMELAALRSIELGREQRKTIERAFADPGFLQNALSVAIALLGTDEAIAIVPAEPRPLRRAFDHLAKLDDFPRAAATWFRWEAAEKKSREAELREIERVAALGDRPRLLRLIREWAGKHSPRDFGDAGAAQLVRLIAVWPEDDPGTWRRDPRGETAQVLLERDPQAGSAEGLAIWRAVRPLDGVPEVTRAEAMLAAGRVEDAERLALQSQTAGSFGWTGFWVASSGEWLRRGDRAKSRAALSNIAPSARGECDVLFAEAAIDARRAAQRAAAPSSPRTTAPLTFSRTGSLPLCLDGSAQTLEVLLDVPEPTLVSVGWNDTRGPTILAKPGTTIRLPLANRHGREILTLIPLAGPRPTLSATLQ